MTKLKVNHTRAVLLHEAYEHFRTGGSKVFMTLLTSEEVAAAKQLDLADVNAELEFLGGNGLLEVLDGGWTNRHFNITWLGVRNVEENAAVFDIPLSVLENGAARRRELLDSFVPNEVVDTVTRGDDLPYLWHLENEGLVEITGSVWQGYARITADGLRVRELPSSTDIGIRVDPEALVSLLRRNGLETAADHLHEAGVARSHRNFSASSGQVRSFLEALFDAYVTKLVPDCTKRGGEGRNRLETDRHFQGFEAKWVAASFAFCHTGAHAGTTTGESNLIMMSSAMAVASHFVLKWGAAK